jgi:hypothetical protein
VLKIVTEEDGKLFSNILICECIHASQSIAASSAIHSAVQCSALHCSAVQRSVQPVGPNNDGWFLFPANMLSAASLVLPIFAVMCICNAKVV